eukprot:483716-Amphidinium_carterae.1
MADTLADFHRPFETANTDKVRASTRYHATQCHKNAILPGSLEVGLNHISQHSFAKRNRSWSSHEIPGITSRYPMTTTQWQIGNLQHNAGIRQLRATYVGAR